MEGGGKGIQLCNGQHQAFRINFVFANFSQTQMQTKMVTGTREQGTLLALWKFKKKGKYLYIH